MMGIRFDVQRAVYIDATVNHADAVSGNSDDPFNKVLAGMNRVMEHDDVAALHLSVRQEVTPEAAISEMQFIYQQIIADQQSFLHRLRRNLERLHDKCH